MRTTIVGIDPAKSSFSLHGVVDRGQVTLRKTVSRKKLLSTRLDSYNGPDSQPSTRCA